MVVVVVVWSGGDGGGGGGGDCDVVSGVVWCDTNSQAGWGRAKAVSTDRSPH